MIAGCLSWGQVYHSVQSLQSARGVSVIFLCPHVILRSEGREAAGATLRAVEGMDTPTRSGCCAGRQVVLNWPPVKVFFADTFPLPLPPRHRFPVRKYGLLRQTLIDGGVVRPEELLLAPAATDAQLLLVHDADYVRRVVEGRLSDREIRRIGLPWSPELVVRMRHTTGGTIAACRAALQDGIAVNLSGGYHHAHRDYGQGYCLFNDVVIAARVLQDEGLVRRVVVLDCDVHQGNATAELTAADATVYTFSIHSESDFPLHKVASDLDIALGDGVGDERYLAALDEGLEVALERAQADLAIYLAGADPYRDDLLGHLALSKEGLAQRDRLVLGHCFERRLPVAVVMAGGYSRRVEDTVEIHCATVRIAGEFAGAWNSLLAPLYCRESPDPPRADAVRGRT